LLQFNYSSRVMGLSGSKANSAAMTNKAF